MKHVLKKQMEQEFLKINQQIQLIVNNVKDVKNGSKMNVFNIICFVILHKYLHLNYIIFKILEWLYLGGAINSENEKELDVRT